MLSTLVTCVNVIYLWLQEDNVGFVCFSLFSSECVLCSMWVTFRLHDDEIDDGGGFRLIIVLNNVFVAVKDRAITLDFLSFL